MDDDLAIDDPTREHRIEDDEGNVLPTQGEWAAIAEQSRLLIEKLTRQRAELAGALLKCVASPRHASNTATAALTKLRKEEGWR